MPEAVHDDAVARSLLRYCPICDAYEITDQKVAVNGTGDRGVNEAVFLRSFTKDVTLISPALEHELTAIHAARLKKYAIAIVNGPAECIGLHDEAISVRTSRGSTAFAAVYSALGSDIHSELAALLGAKRSHEGCIVVDSHKRASVPGLYAAGDVVLGLDQMSHAMGQAGVAATTIRNDLCYQAALCVSRLWIYPRSDMQSVEQPRPEDWCSSATVGSIVGLYRSPSRLRMPDAVVSTARQSLALPKSDRPKMPIPYYMGGVTAP